MRIAVAANFSEPAQAIAAFFERATSHRAILSFGSTGQFYAQIAQGAPFDILLAADQTTPQRVVNAGLGVAGTEFTYAIGRLVLYSRDKDRVKGVETLRDAAFDKLAIANPDLAPYGAAAIASLTNLGLLDRLQSKFVRGNSIAQAFQFVQTGNADLGFVALSQVITSTLGSRWIVPADLHLPIAQDAVLLQPGADNSAARAFLDFIRMPQSRAAIERFGYSVR